MESIHPLLILLPVTRGFVKTRPFVLQLSRENRKGLSTASLQVKRQKAYELGFSSSVKGGFISTTLYLVTP